MRLKLTLVRTSGPPDDIIVTTDAAATIGEVATTIARVDPAGSVPSATTLTLQAALPGHGEWVNLPPDAPVGEAWIGSGATVTLADPGRHPGPVKAGRAPVLATLTISGGDDADRDVELPAGSFTIGRDPSCDLVIDDHMVSKKHARLEVGDSVEIIDLGSANGLETDGGSVLRLHVRSRETVLIGDTRVTVTVNGAVAEAGAAPKAGPIFFNRSPRVEDRYAGEEYASPDVPAEKDPPPFPLIAMITPIMLGGAMFIVTRSPMSLIFIAMSPLMLIGTYLTGRGRDKRNLKKAILRFEKGLGDLSERLGSETHRERTVRLAEAPATAQVLAQASVRGPLLWTRRPEHWSFLNVRLGVGSMTSRNTVAAPDRADLLQAFRERLDTVIEEHRFISGVPVVDNLHDSGALGIAGASRPTAEALNSILIQLTALHSPAELVVAALVTPSMSEQLAWLKWIPHTSSPHSPIELSHLADGAASVTALVSAIEGLIAFRLEGGRRKIARRGAMRQDGAALERGAEVGDRVSEGVDVPLPAVVVLMSDDLPVDRARLVQLAESGADAGVFPIWIANDVASLPAVCRTYVEVPDENGSSVVGFVRLGETITDVELESVGADRALDFARRLAPAIDAGALVTDASDLPRSVSVVSLLGHDRVEQSDAVVDRWRENSSIHDRTAGIKPKKRRAGKLRATIGSAGVDAMHLDLRAQGPHALVGGTTGSGKSEFLQAWVLGMAAEYSPDRVSFLFIDYKGGSAFADCVSLPHCVGLVTDLSPHLVRRALTSLRAELHHREHLLNRKKAKDLLELEKRGDPDSPPALVLVIDEFAALVSEVPEFVDGVVDIAQRGRSLGIHLIMATQRPAGVIKDNLRANTNLRIALRMADESDSQDVVGVKDAAHFDPGIPGRGIAKTGPGRLTLFQSAYAGGWTSREPDRPDIEVSSLRFGGEARWEEPRGADVDLDSDPGPTDQQKLVSRIVDATRTADIPAPRRPWLDELAQVYDLGKLRQRTDSELLIGVADLPERQEQLPVYFRPDVDGHIAIYGTGGSGKSTALRTLATAAAITPRGGPVDVYGLDFGSGGLRMLDALPHVGAVINGADHERIVRLMRFLRAELDSRRERFAEVNAATIGDYRRLSGRADERRLLLLIDGFQAFRQDYEIPLGRSQHYAVFQDVITDGRPLGIHVAFTADRSGSVPTAVSSGVQRRIVLRLADETGYRLLDAPSDVLSAASPAGRAIVDGCETQVAVFGGSSDLTEQSRATRLLAETMARAGARAALPMLSLQREIPATALPDAVDGWPVLGVADDTLEPVGFEPVGTFLLTGPPASGRTSSLRWFARSLRRWDPEVRLYYIGPRRSPLAGLPDWTAAATSAPAIIELARNLAAAMADDETEGHIAVIVEGINEFLQTPAEAPMTELVKAARRSEHLVVAEAENVSWSSSWPLITEVKNGRTGLVLQPETLEGDMIIKTPFPRVNRAEFPVGRGLAVAKGRIRRVQLPMLDDVAE